MKTKLKPEEERTLTPGPQAVDDLLMLPGGSKYVELPDIVVPKLITVGQPPEEYHPLQMSRDCLRDSHNKPLHADLRMVNDAAEANGEFIPSAPLISQAVNWILWVNGPGHSGLRKNIKDAMKGGLGTNTQIDWDAEEITHFAPGRGSYHQSDIYLCRKVTQGLYPSVDWKEIHHSSISLFWQWTSHRVQDSFQVKKITLGFPREKPCEPTYVTLTYKSEGHLHVGLDTPLGGYAHFITAKR